MVNRCRFTPNLKILTLAALLLPVLLLLGNWQLDRAAEKRQILAELEARTSIAPVAIDQLIGRPEIRYRAVRLEGRFDNRHSFLLDNRVRSGRVGYEVITPFTDSSGQQVLVNRGWVLAPEYRHQRPLIPEVSGLVALTGAVYTPLEQVQADNDDSQGDWPRIAQALDFEAMANALQQPIAPLTVRLHEGSPGSLQVGWPSVNVQPEKHTAYAVQWFAMALALLVLTLVTIRKRASGASPDN